MISFKLRKSLKRHFSRLLLEIAAIHSVAIFTKVEAENSISI